MSCIYLHDVFLVCPWNVDPTIVLLGTTLKCKHVILFIESGATSFENKKRER